MVHEGKVRKGRGVDMVVSAHPAPRSTSSLAHPEAVREAPWWVQPLLIVLVLVGFSIYAVWGALHNVHYQFHNYLSPFYSPQIPIKSPLSPAFYVLWIPLAFRGTCYYYRRSYYRAFFWDPPACAVGELRRKRYSGETRLPFILNNLHRFFFYLSVIVVVFLWWDTIQAFIFNGRFGIGLGSLIFLTNVVALSLYTFSCHSFRHLVGGSMDCFSCSASGQTRHSLWSRVTNLNRRHGLFAWISLFTVISVDIYVRLLAAGAFQDPRIL